MKPRDTVLYCTVTSRLAMHRYVMYCTCENGWIFVGFLEVFTTVENQGPNLNSLIPSLPHFVVCTQSLPHSVLSHSLTQSLPRSLAFSLLHLLTPSLHHYLTPLLPRSRTSLLPHPSLPHSLIFLPSLTHSLPSSLPYILTDSLLHSLILLFPHFVIPSLSHILTPLLPNLICLSHPHSITASLSHSLTHSLPDSLLSSKGRKKLATNYRLIMQRW